jgi:hypothetical protein
MTLHKTNDPFDVTNCGAAGWVSRLRGYRYHPRDPLRPPTPTVFTELATEAADWAGYDGFAPDACLINRYEPFDVTGGEAHEVKGYDALMRLHEADPSKLLSDKGDDSDDIRRDLIDRGIEPVVPPRSTRKTSIQI